jgi:hypothetical protein
MIRVLLKQVQDAYRGYSEADVASLDAKLISSTAADEVTWLSDGEAAALRAHRSRFFRVRDLRIVEAV